MDSPLRSIRSIFTQTPLSGARTAVYCMNTIFDLIYHGRKTGNTTSSTDKTLPPSAARENLPSL